MPFPVQVSLEKTELDQQLLAIKDLIETGKRESLRRIGKFLFARVRRDIKTKSQGGKGEDGNTWRELSKNRRKRKRREGLSDLIGVATGLTLSERFVKLSIFSDSVVVSAGGPKRFLFDNQRPIVSKNWFKNVIM